MPGAMLAMLWMLVMMMMMMVAALPQTDREFVTESVTINDTLYVCYNKTVRHVDARVTCFNIGGRVFQPQSKAIERMVAIACDFSHFWLGFRRQIHPYVFSPKRTVTTPTPTAGNPTQADDLDVDHDDNTDAVPYTNWQRGEPNNFGKQENCVSLRRTIDDCNVVYWDDVKCSGSNRQRFVCEI